MEGEAVPSTGESRAESGRVIRGALEALTKIIEQVNQGEQAEPLPANQSCRMAML
jgi:hypothetical protein